MSIELVLEKWLTAFKKYGHTLEIYENPSKKELISMGAQGNLRFILDAKRKKTYIWPATGAIHQDAWLHIKKSINDVRPLYKSSTLIPGVQEGKYIHIYGAAGISRTTSDGYYEEDWSFAKRYIDIDYLMQVIDRM